LTERDRNNLLRYRQMYRSLMDRAGGVLLLLSPEGIINDCSKYVHKKIGLSSEAVVGQSLELLLTPESYETAMKCLKAWRTKRTKSERWEAGLLGINGSVIPLEVCATPVFEKGKLKQVVVIAQDISDQKHEIESLTKRYNVLESRFQEVLQEYEDKLRRIEEESRQVRQSLLEAHEKERNKIGAELHDEIGGYLTILKMYFAKILKEPEEKSSIAQFRETFEEMVEHMRSLSHDLYPTLLEREGLLPALEAYFTRYENVTGIRIRFRHNGVHRRLPFNIEVASYRIVQEALNNAAKHSGAKSIGVELSRTNNTVKICVEDNGKGFDVSRINNDSSGLFMMKARVLDSGGNFSVESSPGQGTRVTCTLAL
jgi:PAS domain S-box-containing protein